MELLPVEAIAKLEINSYEAVIIASKHARFLNHKRMQALENLEENPYIEIDARKITMVAMKDLLEGTVKFTRPDSM